MTIDYKKIKEIISNNGTSKRSVIPVLQAIQNLYNYLPEDALRYVCAQTDITPSEIIGVAGFYHQFRMEPAGEHLIKVCVGTACHVKGAGRVYDAFKRELNIAKDESTDKSRKYTVDEVSCLGCCTLAPVVQIDDVTYGHVQTDQVNRILNDFELQRNKKGHKKFRTANGEEIEGEIRIGLGSCCVASGSGEIQNTVEQVVADEKLNVKLKHVGCVGMCHQVPLVEIVPNNHEPVLYSKVKPDDIKNIINTHFNPPGIFGKIQNRMSGWVERMQSDDSWDGVQRYKLDVREKHVSSFLGKQVPIATEFRGVINPVDLDEYLSRGGFQALEKALKMNTADVITEIDKSGLRGRGGAGFPAGKKWSMVAVNKANQKFVICNGDEGDPGAFMDRMLLESYPFRVIEGVMIGAYAVGASKAFFYIRAEYPLAVKRMQQAIDICYDKNYIGDKADFPLDIEIYQGAGAFVCGEETALIASMEGNRGFPRVKPPFPAVNGLFNSPTLMNNTETFAQVPYIIHHGASDFSAIGSENSKGTKVFALAGKIARGGLIEVPMGITIRRIVDEIGGGVADGKQLKAVQVGGPSGGCVPHWLADTPIDFSSLKDVGAMMGSGGLVVLDETDCMVDIARYFLSFTQDESCGKCTFCRVGTKRMLDIMNRIVEGNGKPADLGELEYLAKWIEKGSLCNLGKTAPNPVLTTLKYFRDEYEAHINGVCPTGKCEELIRYSVNDNCIGCTKCVQKCPVDAIPFTPHEKHSIDNEICIKCDSCRQVCPVDAIDVK
ncbi:MAG: NAD(P)H-dependent oxidoreductase subunit E [Prolixibacteraceae bacterium]|jgi:NADH-quinone oxidoreductase subunit F|nr:NAD(P)H-dependent oxidoreductase subunit E [Prolixibacteraceae bacterium]